MSKPRPKVLTATDSLVVEYPQAVDFCDQQLKVFWLPTEPKVEKDIQDIYVHMTEAERHGVVETLRLFSQYELKAGQDYWLGRFMSIFPRHEFARMASAFGMTELAIHKPFYNRLNELLGHATHEFYRSYAENPTLKARLDFIDEMVWDESDALSLAVFSMVEGAILYSSFAFLKHFQSQGKGKLLNVVRGINFSVRDENLHSIAGAWAFRLLLSELGEDVSKYEGDILRAAQQLYEHECEIVDMLFSKGPITGITADDLKSFVKSRINQCLHELGVTRNLGKVDSNPIAEWFYDGINSYQFNDRFTGIGASYHRDWPEAGFTYSNL